MPDRKRVLLLATNAAGHDAFANAASKLGLELLIGAEVGPGALHLQFGTRDSALRIVQYAMERPLAAIVTADERSLPVAARAASMLGLLFHPPKTGDALCDRKRLDTRLHAAGIELMEPSASDMHIVAVMTDRKLRVLGIFDHATGAVRLGADAQTHLSDLLRKIVKALGLTNGPVYVAAAPELRAVTRVSAVVPQKIASALRFRIPLVDEDVSFEELLIRHALGLDISRAYLQN